MSICCPTATAFLRLKNEQPNEIKLVSILRTDPFTFMKLISLIALVFDLSQWQDPAKPRNYYLT